MISGGVMGIKYFFVEETIFVVGVGLLQHRFDKWRIVAPNDKG